MPHYPLEKAACGIRRRGKLNTLSAPEERRNPAEQFVLGSWKILIRQRIPASNKVHARGLILDAHDSMSIKTADAAGKHHIAASNSANLFALDQENIAGKYRREHTAARGTESQVTEIAQQFRCKLKPHRFPGVRRSLQTWILRTHEFFRLKRH